VYLPDAAAAAARVVKAVEASGDRELQSRAAALGSALKNVVSSRP
jgi:hypothetical protein